MVFDKLKQGRMPMPQATPLSHNPGTLAAPSRQPGVAEQIGTSAVSSGMNKLATSGAEALFSKMAPAALAPAAATGAAGAAATGAAATGAAGAASGIGGGLMAAAMTNPVTAPLAIGAALFGGKKMLGK